MEVDLKQTIEENFKIYAGMVIQQRAICDVRDCIKPSARQLMYAQLLDKIDWKHKYQKSLLLKYIEKLMPALKAAGFIESVHGIGGGYRLAREPETYTLWDILLRSEGDLAPVSCLKDGAGACARAADCRTLPVWEG